MKEIWKDVKGYETMYQVSSLGRFRGKYRFTSDGRTYAGKLFNGTKIKNKPGELKVMVRLEDKRETFMLSRLVATHFMSILIDNDKFLVRIKDPDCEYTCAATNLEIINVK